MAYDFNAAGSTRAVNHGSGASIDNLAVGGVLTVWAWIKRAANGANQHIITKDSSFPSGWGFVVDNAVGEGQLAFSVWRATTHTQYASVAGAVPLDTDMFVAATFDDALAPEMDLYTGTLTAAPTEVTYASTQDGVGAPATDAAADLRVGNLHRVITLPFLGRGARGGVIARRLTLTDLTALWRVRSEIEDCNVADTRLLFDYARGVTYDFSGNENHGTLLGAPPVVKQPWGPSTIIGMGVM